MEISEFLFPWKDALYALYNINFQLLPPCLSELDVNWPQSNIRTGRAQTLPNPVATPTLPDYNIEEDKGTRSKFCSGPIPLGFHFRWLDNKRIDGESFSYLDGAIF